MDNRPGWVAMYDIDDTRTFGEGSVMSRLDPLIRITSEVVGVWGAEEGEAGSSTTGSNWGKLRGVLSHTAWRRTVTRV